MGLFGKSLEDQAAEAVKALRGTIKGLKSLDAVVEGKNVTLTGEADTIEAKGAVMAEFNKLVTTENTFNKVRVSAPPPAPASAPVAAAVALPEIPVAPSAAPAAPAAETRVHVDVKGDTLGAIAKHYYGKAGLYTKIFEANRDVLDDPNLIKPGQRLRIPD